MGVLTTVFGSKFGGKKPATREGGVGGGEYDDVDDDGYADYDYDDDDDQYSDLYDDNGGNNRTSSNGESRKGRLKSRGGRSNGEKNGTPGGMDGFNDEGFDDEEVEAAKREKYGRRTFPAESGVVKTATDGFLARKACGEDLHPPTSHVTAFNAHTTPENDLQLDFAYGYRGHDTRQNAVYNARGRIVYATAATGVVYDGDEHVQDFFTFHGDDILSLAMHPDGDIIATAQAGRDPVICVWSSKTCDILAELRGFISGRWLVLALTPLANFSRASDWTTSIPSPCTIGRTKKCSQTPRVIVNGYSTANTTRTMGA